MKRRVKKGVKKGVKIHLIVMELETSPINQNTINLFTGREQEVNQLDKLLKIYNIAIIEGDYGIPCWR